MKKINLSAAWLCLIFVIACKNNDDVIKPGKNLNTCLITKVTFAGTDAITYTYDSQRRLIKANHAKDAVSNENYYKEYDYNAAGWVTKESFKLTDGTVFSYFAFTYNNKNLLEKIAFFTRQADNTFNHEYNKVITYTPDKKVEKVATYSPANPSTPYRQDIYTYGPNGNISQVKEYAITNNTPVNDVTTEYTYDNQNNPYLNATYLGVGAETISRNNIATEKETFHLSGLVKNYTYTYQYNSKGYPTKQNRQYGTNTFEIVREYSCTG